MIEPMVDSMEKFEPVANFKPKYSQLKVILEERVSSQKPEKVWEKSQKTKSIKKWAKKNETLVSSNILTIEETTMKDETNEKVIKEEIIMKINPESKNGPRRVTHSMTKSEKG